MRLCIECGEERLATFDYPRCTTFERDMRPFAEIAAASKEGRTDDECWPWAGTIQDDGYGSGSAHRRMWIASGRPDPGPLHLDHVCHTRDASCRGGRGCRHRRCINPNHLMPVTNAENQELRRLRRKGVTPDQIETMLTGNNR